ncbi:multidrug effflux MFS transporter [Caldimonas tepidiphila]|uniref:multidrug effflux MFS transporter n=1 Tax=Caldimonas tepidiphila TaxID=2315841 RepID=UPI001473FD4E|nr:multidrug effflux MFS transporter [Caldimonas tepidiphila]
MTLPPCRTPALPPESAAAAGRPNRRSERLLVLNLVAQMAFGLIAMTIFLPSMQEWASVLGASQASVQLTFSGYVLAYGAMQLIYGPLSDRFGRRRMLLIGLALAGTASAIGAAVDGVHGLIVVRILQGAGAAACMVVGRAAVQDLFSGPDRVRVMAYVGMAMGLCPPLATVIGGQIHARLGWQANFVFLAVLALVLGVGVLRGMPARPRQPSTAPERHWLREMGAAYLQLSREPAFLPYVAILSLTVAAFYAFLSGAPLVLHHYGVGPENVGWYIMAVPLAYIGGNYLTSRLAHRKGERWMLAAGLGVSLAGIGLMTALGLAGMNTPLAFVLPLILLGIGNGLLVPACLTATVGLVPALAGSAAALAGVMQQLMGALGAYVVGWVPHEHPVGLGAVMMGFTLAAVAALAVLRTREASTPA